MQTSDKMLWLIIGLIRAKFIIHILDLRIKHLIQPLLQIAAMQMIYTQPNLKEEQRAKH